MVAVRGGQSAEILDVFLNIFKVELTIFAEGLNGQYEGKTGISDDTSFSPELLEG